MRPSPSRRHRSVSPMITAPARLVSGEHRLGLGVDDHRLGGDPERALHRERHTGQQAATSRPAAPVLAPGEAATIPRALQRASAELHGRPRSCSAPEKGPTRAPRQGPTGRQQRRRTAPPPAGREAGDHRQARPARRPAARRPPARAKRLGDVLGQGEADVNAATRRAGPVCSRVARSWTRRSVASPSSWRPGTAAARTSSKPGRMASAAPIAASRGIAAASRATAEHGARISAAGAAAAQHQLGVEHGVLPEDPTLRASWGLSMGSIPSSSTSVARAARNASRASA